MPRESKAAKAQRANRICELLMQEHPHATTALNWGSNWELLVATILSAQCTDEKVNEVTATLFKAYPTLEDYAAADPAEFEQIIRPTGFFRNKTRSVLGAARALLDQFGGQVPQTMEQMLSVPGVARKTANVVLGTAFGIASGVVVDTHVSRLALRMALTPKQTTKTINTDKIEKDLMALIPPDRWITFGHVMIWHGRRVCDARKPLCGGCIVGNLCPRVGV